MSKPGRKRKADTQSAPKDNASRLTYYRIDPPHPSPVVKQPTPVPEMVASLAMQMHKRQGDLDHRESHLNARVAWVDQEVRSTRQWMEEQQAQWEQRQEQLIAYEAELQNRLNRLALADANLQQKTEELAEIEESLADQEKQLQAVQQAEETLLARWQALEEAEKEVATAHEKIAMLREAVTQQQQAQEEALHADRLQLAMDRRRWITEIEQKQRAVERRSLHLDQSRASLVQMRADLKRIQQETLETRLATEEMWAQLSGEAPPAELIELLAKTRAKLASLDRARQEEIEQQKNELQAIRTELIREHRRLVKRKRHFDELAEHQREENDATTRRLVAREKDLNRREAQMVHAAHGWEIERIEYQQMIRRLLRSKPDWRSNTNI